VNAERMPRIPRSALTLGVAVLLACVAAFAGATELVRRSGSGESPVEFHALSETPQTTTSPSPEPTAPTPEPSRDPTPNPQIPYPRDGLNAGQVSDLMDKEAGYVPGYENAKPRLTCGDGSATIYPHESKTVSCELYPEGFRGLIDVRCLHTDICYPVKKGAIEFLNDEPKTVQLVHNVLMSEERSRYTVKIEVYAAGAFYFPFEIVVPQVPGKVVVTCPAGQEIASQGRTDVSCRLEPTGGFHGWISLQAFKGWDGGNVRIPMTYFKVPPEGMTVALPLTATNAAPGPVTLALYPDMEVRFDGYPMVDLVVR
jgi:hypothetical protein